MEKWMMTRTERGDDEKLEDDRRCIAAAKMHLKCMAL